MEGGEDDNTFAALFDDKFGQKQLEDDLSEELQFHLQTVSETVFLSGTSWDNRP